MLYSHTVWAMSDLDPRERLGVAIRKARTELRISQEGLAFECGLHRTYVGAVERGERNISLDNIVKIAKALGRLPSTLLAQAGL